MLIADATDLLARKLTELNRTHLAAGGAAPLQLEPWEFERRCNEIRARVNLLAADGPSMDLLAAAGAHILATMLAVDVAEQARVETGEAA